MTLKPLSIFLAIATLGGSVSAQEVSFSWEDEAGKHMDLLYGERKIARFVYERMDPERREETYKPFHHIYAPDGAGFITKGAGGQFTHHRGVYFGFSKCSFNNAAGQAQTVDSWHCKRAYQTFEKVVASAADANHASQRLSIAWRSDDGAVFINEERSLDFRLAGNGLFVDFVSTLGTELEAVQLDGDPQHAGFHFRASNEVSESTKKETYYIRPETGVGEKGTTINWSKNDDDSRVTNVPWKAMSFLTGGERYTVLYLDHPKNPKPARYSERDYGRFGSYFVAEVTPASPLTVRYRLFIKQGEMSPEECASLHAEWLKAPR